MAAQPATRGTGFTVAEVLLPGLVEPDGSFAPPNAGWQPPCYLVVFD